VPDVLPTMTSHTRTRGNALPVPPTRRSTFPPAPTHTITRSTLFERLSSSPPVPPRWSSTARVGSSSTTSITAATTTTSTTPATGSTSTTPTTGSRSRSSTVKSSEAPPVRHTDVMLQSSTTRTVTDHRPIHTELHAAGLTMYLATVSHCMTSQVAGTHICRSGHILLWTKSYK